MCGASSINPSPAHAKEVPLGERRRFQRIRSFALPRCVSRPYCSERANNTPCTPTPNHDVMIVRMATQPAYKSVTVQKATRTRYWVIVFAVTLAILSYFDRVCMSVAAPTISKDLGLTKVQMGYIFSSFGIAYALFEVPSGWLGDKLGARKVLMRIVLWWSFFITLTGQMRSFGTMLTSQFFFGAGEAGGFPNLTKAFSTWLPQAEKVRAQGIMWMFARWGGAFTPPLVILAFKYMSWRYVFASFGALGVVWAIFFYNWYRDNPRDNKKVNDAELAIIAGSAKLGPGHGDVPWRKLLGSRSVRLLWLQYFLLSYPWYFYITWLPTYLQENRHLTPEQGSHLAVLPLLFGGIGSAVAGFLSARLVRLTGSITRTRRLSACVGFGGAAIMLVISLNTADPTYAMLFMGLTSFFNDLVMPGSWASCMDIGGKYAGTVAGSMNMMGNLAGFAAPLSGGYILRYTGGNWNSFLYVMATMYLLGTFCWPFIDPVTPIDKE
jgi:MFS transporter, ACS family, glucarate transporter